MPAAANKEYYEHDPAADAESPDTKAPASQSLRSASTARGEYTVHGQQQKQLDSVMDRFYRLRSEVQQLQQDLRPLTQPASASSALPSVQKDVSELSLSLTSAANALGQFQDNSNAGLVQVDDVANGLANGLVSQVGNPADSQATYALHAGPEVRAGVVEVDRETAKLTRIVGGLNNDSTKPLIARLQDLQARLELTEEYKLDAVYRRTKALLSEVDTVDADNEEDAAGEGEGEGEDGVPKAAPAVTLKKADPAVVERLNVLHKDMTALQPTAELVPSVVQRLKTQKEFHSGAVSLLSRLNQLEQQQQAVDMVLKADSQALSKVGSQFAANLAMMTKNMTLVQERMAAIEKRL